MREFLSKNTNDEIRIDWFIDERFSGILRNSPIISNLHALPFKKWLKSPFGIYKIYRYMRSLREYDVVIDMQGLLKSALLGRLLHAKKFVGFSKRGCREGIASIFYNQRVDISYDTNILVRNFTLVFSALGAFKQEILQNTNAESLESAIMSLPEFRQMISLRDKAFGVDSLNLAIFSDAFLAHKKATLQSTRHNYTPEFPSELAESKKFLFIIEASIMEKIYPIDSYIALAQMLYCYYKNVDIYILWNTNENDANILVQELESRNIRAIKLPALDLNSVKFTLKNMDIIIGGDTGITHLGWAIGACSIALLGNQKHSSGKNMRHTRLKRVLLGNPYILSKSGEFEISSIPPKAIFDCIKAQIM